MCVCVAFCVSVSAIVSVQSLSRIWLCDPMNRSTPGLPVHHELPEFAQTHVHRVSDAIQPSHPLSSPSPPAPNPSQHQSLFQWVNSLHEVAKVLGQKGTFANTLVLYVYFFSHIFSSDTVDSSSDQYYPWNKQKKKVMNPNLLAPSTSHHEWNGHH